MNSDTETLAQKERRDKLHEYAMKLVTICKIHMPKAADARIAILLYDEPVFAYASSGDRREMLRVLKDLVRKMELDLEASELRAELLK
jgi:protein tyrosine phosphatase (PTP) superfamily phosphohydrolase (DUF442 family)